MDVNRIMKGLIDQMVQALADPEQKLPPADREALCGAVVPLIVAFGRLKECTPAARDSLRTHGARMIDDVIELLRPADYTPGQLGPVEEKL